MGALDIFKLDRALERRRGRAAAAAAPRAPSKGSSIQAASQRWKPKKPGLGLATSPANAYLSLGHEDSP